MKKGSNFQFLLLTCDIVPCKFVQSSNLGHLILHTELLRAGRPMLINASCFFSSNCFDTSTATSKYRIDIVGMC